MEDSWPRIISTELGSLNVSPTLSCFVKSGLKLGCAKSGPQHNISANSIILFIITFIIIIVYFVYILQVLSRSLKA
ncbi:hypothetical protein D3C73_1578450 [compost metagenome]